MTVGETGVQKIDLVPHQRVFVERGHKVATLRPGLRPYVLGALELDFHDGGPTLAVEATRVQQFRLGELYDPAIEAGTGDGEAVAFLCGHPSFAAELDYLAETYRGLAESDPGRKADLEQLLNGDGVLTLVEWDQPDARTESEAVPG